MQRNALVAWSIWRLRWGLMLFFLGLALPTTALIYYAFDQLKWEAFHLNQILAEELVQRIDREYRRIIVQEEARPFTDYAFLNVAGSSDRGFLQRSPLSKFPPDETVPGLIGYFQIDGQGRLSTPFLPSDEDTTAAYGIGEEERVGRQTRQNQIAQILSQNRLVNARRDTLAKGRNKGEITANEAEAGFDADIAEEDSVPAQAAFDRLATSVFQDEKRAKLKSLAPSKMGALEEKQPALKQDERRGARKEQAILPAPAARPTARQALGESVQASAGQIDAKQLRITTFESEIDPLEISLLDSGQFVLFRKVWRNGERQIQGFLVDKEVFVWNVVRSAFNATSLASMTDLTVAYRGQSLGSLNGHATRYPLNSGGDLRGELLYQTALSAPLSDLELTFRVARLPIGPGGQVVVWTAAMLALVLVSGFYQMYRLGKAQIRLARQQQDFVSSVSHELKTPLTSIRMYGEMLREGWVNDAKKPRYYDYIFDESERLSRLINNVLQLARMTRSELPVNASDLSLAECMALIRTKVSVQIERAGFEPVFHETTEANVYLKIDPDHLSQIMINLVDNAIKFSAKQEIKRIEIGCDVLRDKHAVFRVRDYGPGVAEDQMKKIFQLFYRSENELTRETVGTGIGLALVHQLALLMGGRVDVVNKLPGAEFRIYFPILKPRKGK